MLSQTDGALQNPSESIRRIQNDSIRYSYCLTTRNSAKTINECLGSIFASSDPASEVVVVDSMSDDGTSDILRGCAGRVRLISVECRRGRGRQIAFEHSNGQYVIAIDADMALLPTIRDFLSIYHAKFDGLAFLLIPPATFREHCAPFFVAPASVIRGVGGWRDMQYAEDFDLWSRLAYAGKFRFTYVDTDAYVRNLEEPMNWMEAVRANYYHHKWSYVCGCRIPWRSFNVLPLALIAYVSYLSSLKSIPRFDNPAARRVTGVARGEPFLKRLHHLYNCYVPNSVLGSITSNRSDAELWKERL